MTLNSNICTTSTSLSIPQENVAAERHVEPFSLVIVAGESPFKIKQTNFLLNQPIGYKFKFGSIPINYTHTNAFSTLGQISPRFLNLACKVTDIKNWKSFNTEITKRDKNMYTNSGCNPPVVTHLRHTGQCLDWHSETSSC